MIDLQAVEPIVNAVLYEGYVLYPYRASSIKNRQRWTFGGLFPRAYAEAHHSDPCEMQIQCLLAGQQQTAPRPLEIRLRFLHLVTRQAGMVDKASPGSDENPRWSPVPAFEVDGRQYITWEEAVEREVDVRVDDLAALEKQPLKKSFRFAGGCELEPIRDGQGRIAGVLERRREAVAGMLEVSAEPAAEDVWRITVRVANDTPLQDPDAMTRPAAQRLAFASTHTILSAPGARFISMTDVPAELAAAVAACRNQGAWPVLVGEAGRRDLMLASPIILYDYPQLAPESRGDLYDGTEIDEILSLRVMAMTEEERREIAAVDPRARLLLARTAAMTPEHWQSLHGTFRDPHGAQSNGADDGPRLASLRVGAAEIGVGARVRLRPRADGDIMDLALRGKTGVIEGIEQDFEDRVHVVVALDDDPGRDLGLARMPGHRFFFAPDEIDILEPEASA